MHYHHLLGQSSVELQWLIDWLFISCQPRIKKKSRAVHISRDIRLHCHHSNHISHSHFLLDENKTEVCSSADWRRSELTVSWCWDPPTSTQHQPIRNQNSVVTGDRETEREREIECRDRGKKTGGRGEKWKIFSSSVSGWAGSDGETSSRNTEDKNNSGLCLCGVKTKPRQNLRWSFFCCCFCLLPSVFHLITGFLGNS